MYLGRICKTPKQGHKKEANFKNRMNGSSKSYLGANKTWWLRGSGRTIRLCSVCNYLNMVYENTYNLVSVALFRHPQAKKLTSIQSQTQSWKLKQERQERFWNKAI